MSIQESEIKCKNVTNTTILVFGNTNIPVFDVNPFNQVDQGEGSDGEKEYRYYKESDIDDHDQYDYNGVSMDEIFKMFKAKIDKRFEEQA